MHAYHRHTPEQRAAILDEWEATGEHAASIAAAHGIATCTLYGWRRMAREATVVRTARDASMARQARSAQTASGHASFAEVHVRSSSPPEASVDDRVDHRVEIVIGDVAVHVGPTCDADLIARVLTAVRRAS